MQILGRNGLAKRINHMVYAEWTNDNAWALGLLMSDGSFGKNARPQEFKIYNTDLELIEAFKTVFGSDKETFLSKGIKGRIGKKTVGMLCLSSPVIISFLKEINAHGDKDHRNPFAYIPDEFKWSFIKGLFDGDGNAYKGKLSISGRESLIRDVYFWVCDQISKSPNKIYSHKHTERTVYFQFGSTDSIMIFIKMRKSANGTYDSDKFKTWGNFYIEDKT